MKIDPLRPVPSVDHANESLNNGGSKSQGSGNPGPEIKPVKDPFGHDRSNEPAVPPTPTPPQNGGTVGTEQIPQGTVTSGGAGPGPYPTPTPPQNGGTGGTEQTPQGTVTSGSAGPGPYPTPTPPQNGGTGGTEQTPQGTVTSGGAGPANSSAPSNGPTPAPQGGPTQHTSDGSETVVDSYQINPNAQPSHDEANEGGATHLLKNHWKIPVESGTLDNVHFPMKIDESAKRGSSGGNYFAQQFTFTNADGTPRPSGKTTDPRDKYTPDFYSVGYIGLQPSEKDGKARAVFSGFGAGITSSTGTSGADGGPGASNGKEMDFQYGHKYDLSVEVDKNDPNTFNGYAQDVTDPKNPGEKVFIGNLKFDKPTKISSTEGGFVEQYGSHTSGSHQIHGAKGTFYDPYSKTGDKTTQGTSTTFRADTGIGPYGKAITGTTGRVNTFEGTPGGGSSFDVSGAGWKPGTKIPGINTNDEAKTFEPYVKDKKYEPGDLVSYQGGLFQKNEDSYNLNDYGESTPAPNGDSLDGFSYKGPAPSNAEPQQGDDTSYKKDYDPYDPNKKYTPGDVVSDQGSVFKFAGLGNAERGPQGEYLPDFQWSGYVPTPPKPATDTDTSASQTQGQTPSATSVQQGGQGNPARYDDNRAY
jgi:hypothetical protein